MLVSLAVGLIELRAQLARPLVEGDRGVDIACVMSCPTALDDFVASFSEIAWIQHGAVGKHTPLVNAMKPFVRENQVYSPRIALTEEAVETQ